MNAATPSPESVTLTLVAHTNVGKTTLARTLLRRDVGQVLDQAHVTRTSETFEVAAAGGARLLLEDTPGFGDSPRLLKRLRAEGNPVGWFLHQVWDRRRDPALFGSQEAVRSARERADVVLYLVNAAETPEDAAYVRPEMEILAFVGKPVLVLLNQAGAGAGAAGAPDLETPWRVHLAAYPIVKAVLALDAFTRCWVEEHALLDRVVDVLPPPRQSVGRALASAWAARNVDAYRRAVDRLAAHVARAAADRVAIPKGASATERKRAMEVLAERLEQETQVAMGEILALHGLDGASAAKIEEEMKDFTVHGQAKVTPRRGALWGGIVSGALSGLAADLSVGGLTFGGGAVLGAILGALGGSQLPRVFTWAGGKAEPAVTWSPEALHRLVRDTVARYLAVAHFGRGRGGFTDVDLPNEWAARIADALAPDEDRFAALWRRAGSADAPKPDDVRAPLEASLRRLLVDLYPDARRVLG